jgi:hypothetical protein
MDLEASQKLIFSCFPPLFSWAIAQNFKFLERFPTTITTDTWFEGHRHNSAFSCFLPIFVGYRAVFVFGTISTDRDDTYMV